MELKKVSIDALTPYANNAKVHTDEQIAQIKKSIEMYGNNDPIAVWGEDNIIVEGHGRWLALKELGETEVEIIRLDHLTDEQRREYTLVHNKLTMNTGYDFNILDLEIADLDFDGMDFGFDGSVFDEGYGTDFELPDGDKSDMCQITFYLHRDQKELIEYAMSIVEDEVYETFGNKNKHGNEIYEVVRQWAEQRK